MAASSSFSASKTKTKKIKEELSSSTLYINRLLLQSHTLLFALSLPSSPPQANPAHRLHPQHRNSNQDQHLQLALHHADTALEAAHAAKALPALEAKVQLFRGHCLKRMGRWRSAHAAYVRAASVEPNVEALTAECLAHMPPSARKARAREGGGAVVDRAVARDSGQRAGELGSVFGSDSGSREEEEVGLVDLEGEGETTDVLSDEDFLELLNMEEHHPGCDGSVASGKKHMLRDGEGRIVAVVGRLPELKSMKGRGLANR